MTNELVSSAITSMASFIEGYAVTLTALGALTMALLEAYKKLFSVQGAFQRRALRRWLAQVPASSLVAKIPVVNKFVSGRSYYTVGLRSQVRTLRNAPRGAEKEYEPYSGKIAYDELLILTTGVQAEAEDRSKPFSRHVTNALFELDLARMMGQVQDAADAALNNPDLYPNWFAFLTRGCARKDIDDWLYAMQAPSRSEAMTSESSDQKRLADVYGRIRLLMRRQLDSFQTVTAFRWRELNQLWAIILGAALMFAAQFLTLGTTFEQQWGQFKQLADPVSMKFWQFIAVSLLGGVLSPVAKDLVDALRKVKGSV